MEAAKRMYDNSYDQRLETVALAKAYLDNPVSEHDKEQDEEKLKRRTNTGRVCGVIGVVSSLIYCLVIFGLVLMPLVKETEIQRVNIENENLAYEIKMLEEEIDGVRNDIKEQKSLINTEQIAINELGFVRRDESMGRTIKVVNEISLEDAREAFYNKSIDEMSSETLD